MIEILIFFFISSLCTVLTGALFLKIYSIQFSDSNFNLSEKGLYGLLIISFLSLFLNFFFKIDHFITCLLFILPFIYLLSERKKISSKFLYKLILHSLIISTVATIFISFDNVNRPDAGIYHLPYTKIINDYKIFIGVVNLNPLYGATSIFQYTSAFYNNFLFKDVGITIPLALLAIYFIDYFVREFFLSNSDTNKFYRFYCFAIISYFLLEMNRYSDYGNDNPAHIYFFYLISVLFKNKFSFKNVIDFKIVSLISLFCFLNKVFLGIALLIPTIFWIKNKLFKSFKFYPFFSIFFLFIWCLKNILISGCAIYPIKSTCNENLSWYSNKPEFRIASKNLSEFSELHAKGWTDIVDNIGYENYSIKSNEKKIFMRNFNWLNADYISRHSFTIRKKVDIFILYLFFVLSIIFFFRDKKKKIKFNWFLDKKHLNLFLLSLFCVLVLFYKFPVGRYGSSYLSLLIISLLYPFFSFFIEQCSFKRSKKIFSLFLIILLPVVLGKNLNRIYGGFNSNYYSAPWPRIYENSSKITDLNSNNNYPVTYQSINKNNVIDIYFVNHDNFWMSDRKKLCLYNKSPCSQTSENFHTFNVSKKYNYYKINLIK